MPCERLGLGGACCGPERPCCSEVWDLIRDEYIGGTIVHTGNDPAILSPSPAGTTFDFIESSTAGSFTVYQCFIKSGISEALFNVPDYYSPASPRRIGRPVGVEPSTGLETWEYSGSTLEIEVASCEPQRVRVRLFVRSNYAVNTQAESDSLVAAILAAGYTLLGTIGGTTSWGLTSGDVSHLASRRFINGTIANPGGTFEFRSDATYDKTVTGAANIMSGFPGSITVTPAWNPAGVSSTVLFT